MGWKNIGDISAKSGTLLVRDAELDDGGFRVDAIETICETTVGGDDSTFLIRQGEVFLKARDFASALDTVGAKLDGDMISRPDHHGGIETFAVDSDEGLLELCHAAHAYGGIDDAGTSLARIGFPTPYDQDPKFDGEITFYPEGTSLWAIMRLEMDGFDYFPEDEPADTTAVPYETGYGPYAGMPRSIETRADLCKIYAFRHLERDEAGNPVVYSYDYGECGTSEPVQLDWIGPDETDLVALWESLNDNEAPELETSSGPEF